MFFKLLNAVTIRKTILMDRDKIDMASPAASENIFKVGEAKVFLGASGHRGGAELYKTFVIGMEGFHVMHPSVDRLVDVHIGLCEQIGFVEC